MRITLYQRTFPVQDAPVAVSLAPQDVRQRHTFTVGDTVYEAIFKEVGVIVPDDATIDPIERLLIWHGDRGRVRSTGKEVFALAHATASGFSLAK